jgi:hypothetical protein
MSRRREAITPRLYKGTPEQVCQFIQIFRNLGLSPETGNLLEARSKFIGSQQEADDAPAMRRVTAEQLASLTREEADLCQAYGVDTREYVVVRARKGWY